MKKNLLFVMPSLAAGGGEKSLVNLLAEIDYDLYNVDLFLFNHEGLFMELLPRQVKVLPLPETYRIFSQPLLKSILKLGLKGKPVIAFNRVLFTLMNKKVKDTSKKEQGSWKYLSKAFSVLDKKYDTTIGFLEKSSTYFCIDKVISSQKIGWIHNDYDKLGMDPKIDRHYFRKLDHIITVSKECAAVLKQRFPDESEKVKIIYNIVSPLMINSLANYKESGLPVKMDNEISILTIGRLHYQKGYEFAINACKNLVEKGYNIKWNVIGEGDERGKLTKLIEKFNLEKHFYLLGLKSNPYPYIKHADIYVQTSRYEGKSIAIDEAKILSKPIIITDFSTAKDQITHNENGLIVAMNEKSIAEGIEKMITNKELRNKLTSNLLNLNLSTQAEVKKLYKLLG
ncbi:glycosyltransferase [Metabacillus litoralis]|uniref:Glycosyltransferase n=1 Tax=Metabacillus litoralis TaxID=152268 RepID=A0A5C6W3M1_9BACI|nr:glycosyltransferase [Metabacillus litoralis]TXC92363.1 glycosyltransferase [Metabacillus litoralis]